MIDITTINTILMGTNLGLSTTVIILFAKLARDFIRVQVSEKFKLTKRAMSFFFMVILLSSIGAWYLYVIGLFSSTDEQVLDVVENLGSIFLALGLISSAYLLSQAK